MANNLGTSTGVNLYWDSKVAGLSDQNKTESKDLTDPAVKQKGFNKALTPNLLRAYSGEQDVAFYEYNQNDGWIVLSGPSGIMGHSPSTHGFDLVTYNTKTREIHIVDNKSFASGKIISSATAITTNLSYNLEKRLLKELDGIPVDILPEINEVKKRIKDAAECLSPRNRKLPHKIKLVITNAGGQSKGITDKLRNVFGIDFVDVYRNNFVPSHVQPKLIEEGLEITRNQPRVSQPATPKAADRTRIFGNGIALNFAVELLKGLLVTGLQSAIRESLYEIPRQDPQPINIWIKNGAKGASLINLVSTDLRKHIVTHHTLINQLFNGYHRVLDQLKSNLNIGERTELKLEFIRILNDCHGQLFDVKDNLESVLRNYEKQILDVIEASEALDQYVNSYFVVGGLIRYQDMSIDEISKLRNIIRGITTAYKNTLESIYEYLGTVKLDLFQIKLRLDFLNKLIIV